MTLGRSRLTSILLALLLSFLVVPHAAAQEEAAPADAKPVVKVENAGAAPQQVLRYKFNAEQDEQMVIDMATTMTMAFAGAAQPAMKMPVMRMVMKIDPVEVSDKGELTYKYDLANASVLPTEGANPLLVSALKQQMEGMAGLKGEERIDSRGFRLESSAEIPEGTNAQIKKSMQEMQSSLKQVAAPFPEEAVGVGAVWTVSVPIQANGMKIDQVSTYTITKLEGDSIELDVKVTQSAKEQEVAVPQFGNQFKAKLESLASTGEGKIAIKLNQLVPTSSMRIDTKTTISVQGQTVTTEVGLDMKVGDKMPAEKEE